jgi:DNA-binding GntR family transcriptional regulator
MIIERRNITDQIYADIKENIIKNKIKLSEKISIKSIASKYKTSYTPAREAINSLAKDGLIISYPNKEYKVFDIEEKKLFEVMDIRKMIECHSIDTAIKNIEPNIFQNIYETTKKIRLNKNIVKKRDSFFYLSDLNLHRKIVEGTNNTQLIEIYKKIYDIVEIIIYRIGYSEKNNIQFIDEHIEILESILRKDIKTSKELLAIHIDHSYSYYLNSLLNKKKRSNSLTITL